MRVTIWTGSPEAYRENLSSLGRGIMSVRQRNLFGERECRHGVFTTGPVMASLPRQHGLHLETAGLGMFYTHDTFAVCRRSCLVVRMDGIKSQRGARRNTHLPK